MKRLSGGIAILLLGLPAVTAQPPGPDQSATPAEQYKAIVKESQDRYNAAQKEFVASAPKGGTPSDERPASRSFNDLLRDRGR